MVGATSGAGKSTVVTALCRAWARRGRDVVPFKAQNMSNHVEVTADGGEVGRAQAMQALAAGVPLERRMGPVLLKPTVDGTSHLLVMGEEVARAGARGYREQARALRGTVLDAVDGLRREHAWLVAEGAGGAAEINLLDRDLVNLPLAAAAGLPAVLVVDVDRGGAWAAAYGSLALLPPHLRECVRGVVFNRLRGDTSLFADGFAAFEEVAGVPVLGVLPHLDDEVMVGVEDSLDLDAVERAADRATLPAAAADEPLRVVVLRLPHLANPADLDPLVLEPGVEVRWATRPADLDGADLVVLPGSRATVADLDWVRARRLDHALARTDAMVLGLCAGYQMLGEVLDDEVESGRGRVPGLGLLPVTTTFETPKVVARTGAGFQVRWGRPRPHPDAVARGEAAAWWPAGRWPGDQHPGAVVPAELQEEPEGCVRADGVVRGTSLHGLLDDDATRHELLGAVAARRGRTVSTPLRFAAARDAFLDRLADWVETHLDIDLLDDIAATAAPAGEGPGWRG